MDKKTVSTFERLYRERESRARRQRYKNPGHWVETERVRKVVDAWRDRFDREHPENNGGSVNALAFQSKTTPRTIHRTLYSRPTRYEKRTPDGFLIQGCPRFLKLEYVDRLFTAMGCVGLFYLEPSSPGGSDGFADVYFHESVVGSDLEEAA